MFDLYNEISLRVIQDVTNDGPSVFFTMVFIFTKNQNGLSVCVALITINDNSCYFYRKFLSGEVVVVNCSNIAGMLVCLLC